MLRTQKENEQVAMPDAEVSYMGVLDRISSTPSSGVPNFGIPSRLIRYSNVKYKHFRGKTKVC